MGGGKGREGEGEGRKVGEEERRGRGGVYFIYSSE